MLNFMGFEVAQHNEWNHDSSVDWHLAEQECRQQLQLFLRELGALYLKERALWERDPEPEGFEWIDCSDRENSVLAFIRKGHGDHIVAVMNMTPVPREEYRIGTFAPGTYTQIFCSDDEAYGGSGYETTKAVQTQDVPWHGRAQSILVRLPPLSLILLKPREGLKLLPAHDTESPSDAAPTDANDLAQAQGEPAPTTAKSATNQPNGVGLDAEAAPDAEDET
jgi:1,4-alpha-glucan branching enzyme